MDPSPRSLILDLLSTVGRASAPVRALVAAAALFGIAENSLRVALARLRADGLVESDSRGRYRLGPRARAVNEEIRAWRHLESRLTRWEGGWVAVHTAGRRGEGARERRERGRALRLLGFRAFAPGLALRPDNLVGGVAGIRDRMEALGGAGLVFGVSQLDPEAEVVARGLWDADELVRAYRTTRRALEQSAARLPELPREVAMTESFRLGGSAIRQLVLDPLLPEPIVPAAERRGLLEAIRRYDGLGRRAWAGWLGEDGLESTALPAGVRAPGRATDLAS